MLYNFIFKIIVLYNFICKIIIIFIIYTERSMNIFILYINIKDHIYITHSILRSKRSQESRIFQQTTPMFNFNPNSYQSLLNHKLLPIMVFWFFCQLLGCLFFLLSYTCRGFKAKPIIQRFISCFITLFLKACGTRAYMFGVE